MSLLRNRLPLVVLVIAAVTAVLVSWSFYRAAKAAAQNASDGYAQCQKLVGELERLRNAPRIASLEVEPPDRIAARVTSAAANAELSLLSILSVDPQAAVRIGRSAYQVRATQIVLQDATLRQVASFVGGLEDTSSGMVVRDLALNRSQSISADSSERWNARLTLTQMIFLPLGGT